jgi:hypothetical protein
MTATTLDQIRAEVEECQARLRLLVAEAARPGDPPGGLLQRVLAAAEALEDARQTAERPAASMATSGARMGPWRHGRRAGDGGRALPVRG